MEQKFLMDTNAVIDYLNKRFSPTAMALLDNIVDEAPVKVVKRQMSNVNKNNSRLTSHVSRLTSHVSRNDLFKGLPDAIIAATAICNGFDLLTRNKKDFDFISSLTAVLTFKKKVL